MPSQVLVAYATRYGSTREVAQEVAKGLRERGLEVDVKPAQDVRSLEGYRAVVLGAPLYIGKLLKEAHSFLTEHQEALANLPVAVFALGPIGSGEKGIGEQELIQGRTELAPELAKASWLKPISVAVFGGKYDPTRLRLADRIAAVLPGTPLHGRLASDVRDWAAIKAWASDLAPKLLPVIQQR